MKVAVLEACYMLLLYHNSAVICMRSLKWGMEWCYTGVLHLGSALVNLYEDVNDILLSVALLSRHCFVLLFCPGHVPNGLFYRR